MDQALQNILKRDQWVVMSALVVVSAVAWMWLLAGAGMDMNAFEMTRHSGMDMDFMQPAPWTVAYAVLMFFMWWIMMIAMMLPSATPIVLLAAGVNRRTRSGSPPYGSTLSFTGGYLAAWAGFSAVAVAVQWGFERSGWLNAMLVSTSDVLAGVILILTGAWQFSPWKQACLRHCQNPVEFLSRHYRRGNIGAWFMGAHHGLYCLGCCWFLMALLFVGGVMNLYWIIGLTLYVFIEKVLVAGPVLSRLTGVLLVGWGLSILMSA